MVKESATAQVCLPVPTNDIRGYDESHGGMAGSTGKLHPSFLPLLQLHPSISMSYCKHASDFVCLFFHWFCSQ